MLRNVYLSCLSRSSVVVLVLIELVDHEGTFLTTLGSSRNYNYKVVSPILHGGWAFLGEVNKLVPISLERHFNISVAANNASLEVEFCCAGDTVVLQAWKDGQVMDARNVAGATSVVFEAN